MYIICISLLSLSQYIFVLRFVSSPLNFSFSSSVSVYCDFPRPLCRCICHHHLNVAIVSLLSLMKLLSLWSISVLIFEDITHRRHIIFPGCFIIERLFDRPDNNRQITKQLPLSQPAKKAGKKMKMFLYILTPSSCSVLSIQSSLIVIFIVLSGLSLLLSQRHPPADGRYERLNYSRAHPPSSTGQNGKKNMAILTCFL